MAVFRFASRLGLTRIILIAVAGAAGSFAVFLSLSDPATGAGGPDDDDLFGEQGVDGLDGGPGLDHLFGGPGAERVDGGLFGGPGADELSGGPGRDKLAGEEGDDELFGGPANDDLDGGIDTDGLDSDNCQQGTGTGTVVNCEADLAIDVVGPATASPGVIPFRVTVTNNGPSSVGYTLELGSENSNLMCPSSTLEDHSEPELAAGLARTQIYTVTCVDEAEPGGQVSVQGTVIGPDPLAGNNRDSATTQVN